MVKGNFSQTIKLNGEKMKNRISFLSIFSFILFIPLNGLLLGQTFWERETKGPEQDYLRKNGIVDYKHDLQSATIKILAIPSFLWLNAASLNHHEVMQYE